MGTLLWLAQDSVVGNFRVLQARNAKGAYVITPILGNRRERQGGRLRLPCEGYEVSYVSLIHNAPEYCDDPSYADDADIRVIMSGVQTEAEAKAIAQADADDDGSASAAE